MKIRKERAAMLRKAGHRMLAKYLKGRIGLSERVLIEKDSIGRTEHFIPMNIKKQVSPGEIVDVTVKTATALKLCDSIEGSQ
jgi:threonylcarbamoyladenosine tRNA methylthiotransferase MtaB